MPPPFLTLGLEKGDRVGDLGAFNCAEWTITQFAAAKAGLILVTINPAYRPHELVFTLNKVGVKALVCASRFKTSDYPAMIEEAAPDVAALSPRELRSEVPPGIASPDQDRRPGARSVHGLRRSLRPRH